MMKSSMGHGDIEGETDIYSVCVSVFRIVTPDGNSELLQLLSVLVKQIIVVALFTHHVMTVSVQQRAVKHRQWLISGGSDRTMRMK